MEYDIPIVEILEIWYSQKNRKYGVCCTSEEGTESLIWMTRRQFSSFLQQCRMQKREGIYAHYNGVRFLFTVFGAPVRNSDYRLALHFNFARNMLERPVPEKLIIPEKVEIDDALRDQYQN